MPPLTSEETVPVSPRRKSAYFIIASAILIFGAWTSFRYGLGAWGPDSDNAVTVAIWDGVSRGGLGFIKTWIFTQDNYLFTLVIPSFAIFKFFGTNPLLVDGIGWGFFMACVGLSSFLVYRMAGLRAAYAAAVILLFSNFLAQGMEGRLSHPTNHNISMAWALLALTLALYTIERKSLLFCIAAGLCVFADTVSDPWAGPAIALPLILVSGVLAWLHRHSPQGWYAGALCATTCAAWGTAFTKLFGILNFLSSSYVNLANPFGLVSNVGWMFQNLAIEFNIIPFSNINFVPVTVFDFLVFMVILIGAVQWTLQKLRQAALAQQLIGAVAILSVAGVSVLFLLRGDESQTYNRITNGRFLVNVYFFSIILGITAVADNWERLHLAVKTAAMVYGLLLILSGLSSNIGLWIGKTPLPTPKDITDLGSFLEQNGLSYGYGTYFGSGSLCMNWLTQGLVTIRPVAFSSQPPYEISRLRTESSRLWYLPADQPAETKKTFLVLNDDWGELLRLKNGLAVAEEIAVRELGRPSRRLQYGRSIILVWPHPILSKLTDHPVHTYSTDFRRIW